METKYYIDNSDLKLLVDPDLENRVRALEEIIGALRNNINFTREWQGESGVGNLDVLVRNLIRWFQFKPLSREADVLDLLILILSRTDFIRHVVKHISISRLKKEFRKVNNLVQDPNFIKLQTIEQLLEEYESESSIEFAAVTGSCSYIDSPESNSMSSIQEDALSQRFEKLIIPNSIAKTKSCETEEEEIKFWQKLDGLDLDIFNGIDAELSLYEDIAHLRNVLYFLQASADDFPAEFFLQPPNILESLINIVHRVDSSSSMKVVTQIRFLVNSLKDRWLESLEHDIDQEQSFVPLKKNINCIVRMLTNYFEQFHQNFNSTFFGESQELLNEMYLLVFDIASFVNKTQNACEIFLNELMNSMAKVAKDLRLCYLTAGRNSGNIRLHYMICIFMVNTLVASMDTNGFSSYCENNIWEFESDVALLDVPLKLAHSGVYSLIKKNRKSVIKDDKDLSLLLNIKSSWRPVVELFQDWKTMSNEEIIMKGAEAIDTIRIHKSLEFVDLLMETIVRSSEKLSTNEKLNEAVEEIYLRLLSIEVPIIREHVYSNARNSVQKKIQNQFDEPANCSLSSVIGIPVSTEIVTEILCFGFVDINESIRQNAKIILFSIMRSKMISSIHWSLMLGVIKPILPLMTCLCSIDEKMGIIVNDIYHQHSGFDEMELNQTYARFLFCTNPKARNDAKDKLLSNFKLPNDLIEVVPDNFCLIPMLQVQNIQMPCSKTKYNVEGYDTISQVLKTMDRSDSDLVQSTLIQLSIAMTSRELCQKSHDDNLWVFFVTSLDMGFPDHAVIRKLIINILYKWVVCVPTFRIYLANEPSILEFLIKTLIFYQEYEEVKRQSSSLLFLLLFVDFIVTTESSISMPMFLEALQCPFKFNQHWTESPFNKITGLEQLQEVMEATNDVIDIREISQRYMKFTFALEWFKGDNLLVNLDNFGSDSYYRNRSEKTLKVNRSLQLTDIDMAFVKQSESKEILKDLCHQLDNTTVVQNAQYLIYQMQSLLIIPAVHDEGIAEKVDQRIERLAVFSTTNDAQRKMFLGFMQIYRRIMKWLKDERIVNLMNKNFVLTFITRDVSYDDEAFVECLHLVNSVVKLCQNRSSLMEMLIESFKRHQKVHLPSKLVEKLWDYLTTGTMRDVRKWKDPRKRPIVNATLMVIRNVLNMMPIQLDDTYLTKVFNYLLEKSKALFLTQDKSSSTVHIYSSTMKYVYAILLKISSFVKSLKMQTSGFVSLSIWTGSEQLKYKIFPWMIIAELTKTKDDFASFCKGYEETTGVKIFVPISSALLDLGKRSISTSMDQKALITIIANILDHDSIQNSISGIYMSTIPAIVDKLVETGNISALSFIIRKMVQNDVPKVVNMLMERDVIRRLINYQDSQKLEAKDFKLITEQLETIIVCYKHKPLKDYVAEIVTNEMRLDFMLMFTDTKGSSDAVYKKFNHNAFNVMLIMSQSEIGLNKVCRLMGIPRIIDQMMYASHDSLRVTNPHNELMFQLGFWCSLLDANALFNSAFGDLISTHLLDVTSGNCTFVGPNNQDDNSKMKVGTVLEKEFKSVRYAIDLLFLQVVSIFDFVFSSKFSAEYKHDIKALCFLIIRKLNERNDRVRQLSKEINLVSIITDKLSLSLAMMQSYRHLETTKKNGVQKCHFMIKDLCIFLKALTEWNLALEDHSKVIKHQFCQLLKIADWIEADSVLKNCFLNVVQSLSNMATGRSCLLEQIEGKPLVKSILKKTQALSVKPPHTEMNLVLMKNGLTSIKCCCRFVEVRMMLKSEKIFQILELLHPQIHCTRKTTWDEVTVEWLKFFEFQSRFDDAECLPNHVSLLCRLFRLGNAAIRRLSLVIIRNFSLKAPIGNTLLSTDDFKQTVDSIMLDSKDTHEKFLILQTLLSIASKSEQYKAKLKNSSLNRTLKDQLAIMKSDSRFRTNPEHIKVLNLASMLNQMLYQAN